MKFKAVIKYALLIFVIASCVALFVKESQRQSAPAVASAAAANPQTDSGKAGTKVAVAPRVVAYYFHTTFRCASCTKIEAYSHEAIEREFSKEWRDGALDWRVINVEVSGNRHYIDDYRLVSKSLILVHLKDGKQQEWKNLQRVWELLGNKEAFMRYVQDEVRAYLEAS